MKTNVVMHLTALSGVNGNNSLREGGSVYVRIIKSAGNNSYIASFSGGRFLLKSEIPLSEGAGFPAKIKIENGKILLQKIHADSHKDSVQKITAENKNPFLETRSSAGFSFIFNASADENAGFTVFFGIIPEI
ncbi:MAG: hypothetical protein L6V86_08305 [Treponema sp.]|nr:MAG: hypothetical protein L6V86_08305 [Treponema sp.]